MRTNINVIFKTLTLCFLSVLFICFPAFSQTETITISTYYPSPQGVFRRIVTTTLGVGDTNNSGTIDSADAPDPANNTQKGDLWVFGDVGIGNTTPQNRLDVSGSAVIGATYAGATAAPANGLLVQGDVGIGLTAPNVAPGADLEINNTMVLVPADSAPVNLTGQPLEGTVYYSNLAIDKRLKFHDGSGWKYIGGILGPETAPEISSDFQQPVPGGFPYTVAATCPANSVVTEVRVYTANACPHGCGLLGGGAFTTIARIWRIGVVCKELQQ